MKVQWYDVDVQFKAENIEWVYLHLQGKPIPFLVEDQSNNGDLLKFDWYDNPEDVSPFLGVEFSIVVEETTPELRSNISDTANPSGYIGYEIHNHDQPLGIVGDVSFTGNQYLLEVVTQQEKTVLVPFHTDLLSRVDDSGKKLHMQLPEGLENL